MTKAAFKKRLEEKLDAFFETEEGKEAIKRSDGTPKEQFEFILDEFTYWVGRTDGL